eukprot:Phypoly_transcript_14080.p1 GENE.Phypoly_transcript_14080~~Phypoly_transcript_14080.p1  ORF type:complete len:205 (+),score=28.32 Phypoly_transcript_14080:179-793(+)
MAGEPQEYDVLLKVLMIGDSDVGKSSILLRFTDDLYNDEQPVTIGVDFKIKMVEIGGKKINLTIWDTAGQEKFRSLTSSYYRGTQGIILVYDVTRRESFANLTSWLSEIETYTTNPDVVKLLVGNKVDKENREVSREEAVEFARSQAMLFIECSAKTRLGVQQAFEELVMRILETPTLLKSHAKPAVNVDASADGQQDGYACYC